MKQNRREVGCIFCQAAVGSDDEETLVVFRGRFSFVLLNRYPYTSGHVMVAPYDHVPRLSHVNDEVAAEIMALTRCAEKAIGDTYSPDGLNLGMNMGEAAGAGIEQHIHMHVLPRWKGDANFMTSVGSTRIIPELLSDTWAKLRNYFLQQNKI